MSTRAIPAATLPDRPPGAARVLHTSDWHLGVAVRGMPRDADHDAVLAEIRAIAEAAAPDLIVHTGDLFHGGRPAMGDFGRAIRALRSLAEVAPVVVLAGNHDSATALEVLGVALHDDVPARAAAGRYDPHSPGGDRIRIHPRPTTPARGAVATYPTAAGGRLRLASLPFVHANRVLADFDAILTANATYADSLRKIADLLASASFQDFDPASDVAVFASHLHVSGARTSSEKEIHISTDYATDPAQLEGRFGYLALGHIHVPQVVADGRGRYAGSILEVDFGEAGETKQVVVADLAPGRPTRISDVALQAGRRLRRVRAPLSALAAQAGALGDAIVEVTVTSEPPAQLVLGDAAEFDTLTEHVRHLLPDTTVVAVVDARRADVELADDLEVPERTESVNELFRAWLPEARALFARPGAESASLSAVAELFDRLHAAGDDDQVDLPEVVRLAALDPDLAL